MRAREVSLALGLALFLFFEAASFRRWELKRRVLQLPKLAGLPVGEAERRGSLFEFDPAFGPFLEKVRQTVPPGASVAVSLPESSRLYFYTAHYALAPRPVIEFHTGVEADFLATYGGKGAGGGSLRALR